MISNLTPLMTLHNRSDQCAIENPSLSSAQATMHATKQQHDPSTYEMTTSTNARANKARQVETEKDRAMNARSNRKEMSDERHLETSGERCAGSKRGDER